MRVIAIREKRFTTVDDLRQAVASLLIDHMARSFGQPHAVMLSGGQTPLPVYAEVARRRVRAADDCSVLFSDERMVPPASPESNYGNTREFLTRLGFDESRVMRVHGEIGLKRAADQYACLLNRFLKFGGRITLGLLGLGSDGHTASLFSLEDVRKAGGSMAVAVRRPEKPDRVTVTPDLLKRVETLIFVVTGADKREAVARLLKRPEQCPAGLAVRDARNVQVWTA